MWKSKRYDHVQPALFTGGKRPKTATRPRENWSPFMTHENLNILGLNQTREYVSPVKPGDRDHIQRNIKSVSGHTGFTWQEAQPDSLEYKDYGWVPDYIYRRKAEIEDERIRSLMTEVEDPVPPGTWRLSEEEWLDTLQNLKRNKSDLEARFNALPVSMDTMRAKNAMWRFEQEIRELDSAIAIFSRTVVYVDEHA